MGIAPKNPKAPAWSFGTIPGGQPTTKPQDGIVEPEPITDEERLKRLMSTTFGIDEDDIVDNTHFIHDLEMDSLDLVELSMACEDEFGIEWDDGDHPQECLQFTHQWLDAIQTQKETKGNNHGERTRSNAVQNKVGGNWQDN